MYSYTHTSFFLFSSRTHADKCCIFNDSCQKSHMCWHIMCFNLSASCLLECIAGWNWGPMSIRQ